MNREALILAAKKSARRDVRARRDPRYQRAMGAFVAAGLLSANRDFEPPCEAVSLSEVLWAGKLEPRLLEVLPAVMVKRPALIDVQEDVPDDLAEVLWCLMRNELPPAFRGIPGRKIAEWVPRVGQRQKVPTRLKSFRLRKDDVELLRELASTLDATETDVIRAGLRALAEKGATPPVRLPKTTSSRQRPKKKA